MRWRDVKRALKKKSDANVVGGAKHDRVVVNIDDLHVGTILVSRSPGELRDREIGNCARSLGLKERQFRELVACPLDRAQLSDLSSSDS